MIFCFVALAVDYFYHYYFLAKAHKYKEYFTVLIGGKDYVCIHINFI